MFAVWLLQIKFENNGLIGTIPSEIGNLTRLRRFQPGDNNARREGSSVARSVARSTQRSARSCQLRRGVHSALWHFGVPLQTWKADSGVSLVSCRLCCRVQQHAWPHTSELQVGFAPLGTYRDASRGGGLEPHKQQHTLQLFSLWWGAVLPPLFIVSLLILSTTEVSWSTQLPPDTP